MLKKTVKMKNKTNITLFILSVIGCLLLTMSFYACNGNNSETSIDDKDILFKKEPFKRKPNTFKNSVPNHLVLIYEGGAHRNIKWDKDYFAPYVSAEINGKEKWMFDGFLFLEIHNGEDRGFATGYKEKPARKSEWEKLLLGYFRKGNAISALNDKLKEVRQRKSNEPFEKRKIVISVPEPIPNQTDWGELNGKKLNFSLQADRLEACKWFINRAEELFNTSDLQELELVGFYWLAETATHTRNLVNQVSEYLDKKNYDFYWIPYYVADGYAEWQELGFNVPYYQPNYFFNDNIPVSRLQNACDRAKKYGMNLEVEFDDNALAKYNRGYKLTEYLDVFERNGVFDSLKVAYYQGGDTFYKLANSTHEADKALYNRLVSIVTKSNNKN